MPELRFWVGWNLELIRSLKMKSVQAFFGKFEKWLVKSKPSFSDQYNFSGDVGRYFQHFARLSVIVVEVKFYSFPAKNYQYFFNTCSSSVLHVFEGL